MSADWTALLRDAYEQVNRRDLNGFLNLLREDVEWTSQVLPETKVYRGHAGFLQWVEDITQVFTWGTYQLVGVEESDDAAVAELVVRTTGAASGADVTATVFHAIRFRDGKIGALTALFDRDEARRAAGLG